MAALRRASVHSFLPRLRSGIRFPSSAAAGGCVPPEPGDDRRIHGVAGSVIHRRPLFQAAAAATAAPSSLSAARLPPISGDLILETIRGLNLEQRIRIDDLPSPPPGRQISVAEAKKVLRASLMEAARARLRDVPAASVAYSEFLEICGDESIARSLDDSGAVIVLGNVVFPRPEEVARTIEKTIQPALATTTTPTTADTRRELESMAREKAAIDRKAEAGVRRELWLGLGLVAAQTAGLMRLTFWELSWDVMEPICFFFTSMYFMGGYAFFLLTARDPSFEGIFAARFAARQRHLIRARGFDLKRFNELSAAVSASPPCVCDCRKLSSSGRMMSITS